MNDFFMQKRKYGHKRNCQRPSLKPPLTSPEKHSRPLYFFSSLLLAFVFAHFCERKHNINYRKPKKQSKKQETEEDSRWSGC